MKRDESALYSKLSQIAERQATAAAVALTPETAGQHLAACERALAAANLLIDRDRIRRLP